MAEDTVTQQETQNGAVPVTSSQQVGSINREFQEKSIMKRAAELGVKYINIAKTPLNPDFLKLVDVAAAKEGRIIPFFKIGNKVRVALEDPTNPNALAVIEAIKAQGHEVDINLASKDGMEEAFKVFDQTQQYKKIEIVESVEDQAIATYEKEIAGMSDLSGKLEGVTAQEGVNLLNVSAMKTKASDVHYEPSEGKVFVRFRIDGILHRVFEMSSEIYHKIAEQIKYQGKMQLNIVTVPQDGRYVFNYNTTKVAVRVSSIPTPYGESIVCRYLPADKKALTFEDLGFEGLALKKLQKASKIAQGMILVTGPTGSGKSTTLFSLLNQMNTPENKVITLEDPVEYYITGVTQSQIDEKNGYTFASGLRTVLRQDPDVVMLGEIRDIATAETAAQAALTGHTVLSTLHTNSAIETIPRLVNMGLKPFMVAPSMNTIVAQRLVRKVCSKCSTLEPISASEREEYEPVVTNLKAVNKGVEISVPEKLPKVHGCEECSNTGYNGRLVISEVLTVSSEIKSLILENASSIKMIQAARKDGIITIREDGFMKVAKGLTTLEEVYRVTNVSS